jgi:putative transposase
LADAFPVGRIPLDDNEDMAMAGMPSFVVPGAPLHVSQWSGDARPIFLDAQDCAAFVLDLGEAAALYGCAIHAYVLMADHVRLLLTPAEPDGPSQLMRALGRRHERYRTRRHARSGTLPERRLRSAALSSDRRLLACSRLIEMSPVRAGVVPEPAAYGWSSFRFNAFGARDAVTTPHPAYLALASTNVGRQRAYRALFEAPLCAPAVRLTWQRPGGRDPSGGLPGRCAAATGQRGMGPRESDAAAVVANLAQPPGPLV